MLETPLATRPGATPAADGGLVAILAPASNGARLSWWCPASEAPPGVSGFAYVEGATPDARLERLAARQRRRIEGAARWLRPQALAVDTSTYWERTRASTLAFSGLRLAGATHHVFVRGLGRLPRFGSDEIARVTIVSGVCPFSDRAVSIA